MLKSFSGMNLTFNKEMLIGLSSGAFFAYFFYKTYSIYLVRKKYRDIPGPPTNGILGFYFGNFLEVRAAAKSGRLVLDLVNEWFKFYW